MLKAAYNKNAADQEHQGHEEDVIKVNEQIQAIPSGSVYNRVGGGNVSGFIKPCKGSIGERGMMGYHQNGNKGAQIIYPPVSCHVGILH